MRLERLPSAPVAWTVYSRAITLVEITETTGGRSLVDRIRHMTTDEIVSSFIVSEEFMDKLKFFECLPKTMVQELLCARLLNQEDIQATRGRAIVVVEEGA